MDKSQLDIDRTIVAMATPPIVPPAGGLRTVVRLSGPNCIEIASAVLRNVLPPIDPGHGFSVHSARLAAGMPAAVCHFRAGHSYTGQPMLELHLPGSTVLADAVVAELIAAGASPAGPGEFTLRAVLSGRIDLTGAEAVAGLIAARGDGQLRAAMQLADGELARRANRLNDRLIDVLAEVEAALDFADEPLEFITPAALADSVAAARGEIADIRRRAGAIESLEHRPTVGLVGRPNAGKSSLLNRLSGIERSLCSPLPGTTRDILSAPLELAGGEMLLLDSAGIDEWGESAGSAGPAQPISADPDDLARAAALKMAATADLLLVVLDPTQPLPQQLAMFDSPRLADRPRVLVCNKTDLLAGQPPPAEGALPVSAATGQGIERLKLIIAEKLSFSADRPGEQLMLNSRHRAALAEADAALARAADLLADAGLPAGDLLAGELREAAEHIGQISGEVINEDVLDRIFSRFCVGK